MILQIMILFVVMFFGGRDMLNDFSTEGLCSGAAARRRCPGWECPRQELFSLVEIQIQGVNANMPCFQENQLH